MTRNRCLYCARFLSDFDIAEGLTWESDDGAFGEEPPLFLYAHGECHDRATEDRRRALPPARLAAGWAA